MDGTKEKLSSEFSRIIRRDLTAAELRQAVRRNKRQTDKQVCHTQDFMDANMSMDEAFTKVVGREIDLDIEADTELWGAAWDLSKEKEFRN